MSSEATAASILVRGWLPGVPIVLLGTLIIVGVTLLNLLGAKRVSKFESGLAAIKVLAIIAFIVLAICLIAGLLPNVPPVGTGALDTEPLLPAGIGGIAGSMLIVMLSYSGFEVIGLAASEAKDPHRTVPKAIIFSVLGLVGLYLASVAVLLPLIGTTNVSQEVSPFVAALAQRGMGWAGNVMRIVLVSAILATMLAAMFGLGRIIRSLAAKGQAPAWLQDRSDTPYRGILFSGAGMTGALALGALLPQQVYIFLVSAGGFAILFTYGMIVATHYKFRKQKGCPEKGKCRLPGYPFSSWAALLSLIAILGSMPLVPGQGTGLIAGLILVVMFAAIYLVFRPRIKGSKQ
jgi:AAT family amino acid transporter